MTNKVVIDTNVAISANGKDTHASLKCQLACIEFLENCHNLDIAIDQQGLIMEEYAKHLSYAGQPGVGDMFFKYLHDNQYTQGNIYSVIITPSKDPDRGFNELPPNKLDPSDRKFLATAVVVQGTIINATDSDWREQNKLLEMLNIRVNELCPEYC